MSYSSSNDTAHFGEPHHHTCQDIPYKADSERLERVTFGLERAVADLMRAGTA